MTADWKLQPRALAAWNWPYRDRQGWVRSDTGCRIKRRLLRL